MSDVARGSLEAIENHLARIANIREDRRGR